MAKKDEKFLRDITTSQKNKIGQLRYGVKVESATNKPIDELVRQATKDRLRLAEQVRRDARLLLNLNPIAARSSISRSYYAMYHASRSLLFFMYEGDDHQEHKDFFKYLPKDFPNAQFWENELKQARLERNTADYDPYPLDQKEFAPNARTRLSQANKYLPLVRSYLKTKGLS